MARALAIAAIVALVATAVPKVSADDLCPGDCDGNNAVTIDELLVGVNIALGNDTLDACPSFDTNADTRVTVEDLVAAVAMIFEGCPEATPSPTPPPTRPTPTTTPYCLISPCGY